MLSWTTVRDDAATLARPLALLTLLLALWTVWSVVLLLVGVVGVALLASGVGEPPAWFGVALFSVAVLAAAVTFAMYVYSVALDDPDGPEEGLAAGVDGAVASLLEQTGAIDASRVGTARTDPPSAAASLVLLVVGLVVPAVGSAVLLLSPTRRSPSPSPWAVSPSATASSVRASDRSGRCRTTWRSACSASPVRFRSEGRP